MVCPFGLWSASLVNLKIYNLIYGATHAYNCLGKKANTLGILIISIVLVYVYFSSHLKFLNFDTLEWQNIIVQFFIK